MNYSDRFLREIANYSPLDVMLADIAVRIQLSPTDYQRAVEHYHAINEWIDREDSPLHGLVQEFYAQGGFAIGATVARHATDDEFDIDVMAQLTLPAGVDPEVPLFLLDKSIRGERGSRYHDKADRKTRCSTVYYNGMHLDVTPAVRVVQRRRRRPSSSTPSREPSEPKQTLVANPFGFAQWFLIKTPADEAFAQFFEKRSLDYDRMRLLEKADAAPVPQQMPAYRKSRAVIALQLIKRWRNLAYDRRHTNLRRPPSVLLAYYVAEQCQSDAHASRRADPSGRAHDRDAGRRRAASGTVRAFNPTCDEDELTDRWPCDFAEQRVFIDELRAFAVQLHRLRQGVPLARNAAHPRRPVRRATRAGCGPQVHRPARRATTTPGRDFTSCARAASPPWARPPPRQPRAPTPRSSPCGD